MTFSYTPLRHKILRMAVDGVNHLAPSEEKCAFAMMKAGWLRQPFLGWADYDITSEGVTVLAAFDKRHPPAPS